jgi:TonB-linked SusC/RagA family outer membrane protein
MKYQKLTLVQIFALLFVSLLSIANSYSASAAFDGILIRGTITDSRSGETLPGANVVISGTTIGVVADINGNYSITVPDENTLLTFSFIGYLNEQIRVGDRRIIDVSLTPDIRALDEFVVVGYSVQRKTHVTGSVATVSGGELIDKPVSSITQSMGGRLPGVVALQRKGEPGRDQADINIRGFGRALIIVDGVEQSLDQIDMNTVESISILKDAAASIYGSRAAHGVIIVTTKRGKPGKPTINVSANQGWQTTTKYPRMADAGEFVSIINQGRINEGRSLKYDDYYVFVNQYISGNKDIINQMTPEQLDRFNNDDLRNYFNEDPWDAAFKKWGRIDNYNINSRGGSENVKYFLSGGILNHSSILRTGDTYYLRYNVNGNIDAAITDRLNVQFDMSGRYEDRNYPAARREGTGFNEDPMQWIMQLTFWGEPGKPKRWPDPTKPAGGIATVTNADIVGYHDHNYKEFNVGLGFDYDIPGIEGLMLRGKLNNRTGNFHNKFFHKEFYVYDYDYAADVYTRAESPSDITSIRYRLRTDEWLTGNIFLNYEKNFGRHELKALAGYEGVDESLAFTEAYREDFFSTAVQIINAGGNENKDNSGFEREWGRASYLGRINYSFDDKYLLEGTFRYDGNSAWADKYRWGFFPGFSAGWRISEERFIQERLGFIESLSIRGSWGILGDDAGGIPYQYLDTYSITGNYLLNGRLGSGIQTTGISNPFATWAEYKTYNGGLDFNIFNSRIYGIFDVFYRYGYNLLGTRADALPTTFGASFPQENLNSSSNRGFELSLGHRYTIGNFLYSVEGNVSWNRARWEHFEERDFSDAEDWVRARDQISGRWQNVIFGYKALGLFQTQEEIDNWSLDQDGNGNATIRPGDIKYKDLNGDGKLDRFDQTIIGNTVPLTFFGLNFAASWKNFDVLIFAQGAKDFHRFTNEERVPAQFEGNTHAYIANDSWTPENPNAQFPRFVAGGAANNRPLSSFWVRDASYIRLKNIQIGYTIPKSVTSRIGIPDARIYFAGVNLYTWSSMVAYDPEAPSSSEWANAVRYYPQQKTYSFGLNMTF